MQIKSQSRSADEDPVRNWTSNPSKCLESAIKNYDTVSNEHAKGIKKQIKQTKAERATVYKFSLKEPDRLIREKIETELKKKVKKKYAGVDEIWLAIYQQAELSDIESTDLDIKQIKIPIGHAFDRLFLVHTLPDHDGGGYRIVQFSPTREDRRFGSQYLLAEAFADLLDNDGSIWVPRRSRILNALAILALTG